VKFWSARPLLSPELDFACALPLLPPPVAVARRWLEPLLRLDPADARVVAFRRRLLPLLCRLLPLLWRLLPLLWRALEPLEPLEPLLGRLRALVLRALAVVPLFRFDALRPLLAL
jgi:hypothetical protein